MYDCMILQSYLMCEHRLAFGIDWHLAHTCIYTSTSLIFLLAPLPSCYLRVRHGLPYPYVVVYRVVSNSDTFTLYVIYNPSCKYEVVDRRPGIHTILMEMGYIVRCGRGFIPSTKLRIF